MQHIIQHLFQADTLEDVPRERLEALVEEYPSFGIARYLLSSKLRAEHADHFEEETRKTNLYFTNPFWLQWLLQQGPVNGAEKKMPVPASVEVPAPVEEEPSQVMEEIPAPVEEEPSQVMEDIPAEMVEARHLPQAEEKWVEQPAAEFEVVAPVGPAITPPLAEQPPVVEQPLVAEEPPVFESYHMIDYFASQGIKLAPDENPADRLGKQLKSFTEWLKVMKRLPQKEAGVLPDAIAENKIQAIAAHSIEGKEVVTETMAEVLAKQGMWEKASEVYHKLSLLNPDKSGYFAAKIEQLKSN